MQAKRKTDRKNNIHTDMDALQRVMNTFKQFDRKLDKIQADVDTHSHTLTDLKSMILNLSACTIVSTDGKVDIGRNAVRRSMASQCDESKKAGGETRKTKRNSIIQPLPSKIMEKRESKPEKFNWSTRRTSPKRALKKPSARLKKSDTPLKIPTTIIKPKTERKLLSKLTA